MIMTDTVDTTPTAGSPTYPAHAKRVWITEGELPAGTNFQVLETIDVGTIWYGGYGSVDKHMADRARQIGADAIILTKTLAPALRLCMGGTARSWRSSKTAEPEQHRSGDTVRELVLKIRARDCAGTPRASAQPTVAAARCRCARVVISVRL
jgi:hypothetical protein